MHRFMDLSSALSEAVALVAVVDAFRTHRDDGVLPSTAEIIARFQGIRPGDQDDKRWALFRDCQRVVNPVQSSLQGAARRDPALSTLLTRIVNAKSQWAVFERYPHAALHHAVH
jgi:hypothetical protein